VPAQDREVFEQRMAELRRRFADRLSETLESLRPLIAQAPDTPQARVEAHRIAHRLVGSSGTIGLTELSVRFRALEETLHSDAPTPSADALEKLLEAIDEAHREAAP
jgi:HPt (histidine-containing phosphotransfer) domain-containing protein